MHEEPQRGDGNALKCHVEQKEVGIVKTRGCWRKSCCSRTVFVGSLLHSFGDDCSTTRHFDWPQIWLRILNQKKKSVNKISLAYLLTPCPPDHISHCVWRALLVTLSLRVRLIYPLVQIIRCQTIRTKCILRSQSEWSHSPMTSW